MWEKEASPPSSSLVSSPSCCHPSYPLEVPGVRDVGGHARFQRVRQGENKKEAGDGQGDIRKGTFSLQPTALGFKLQRSYPQLPYDKTYR